MSNAVEKEYVKRVADVLKRTGHPRAKEVLEELQAHLDERKADAGEAADLAELVEALGSPEEYAENLAPATGYRPQAWYLRRRFHVAACVVIVALIAYFALVPDRHTLMANVREAMDRNFMAYPFFDLDKAQNLTPGMSQGEIRDAIGIPLHRFSIMGREDEVVWDYTALSTVHSPFYSMCWVVVDATNWQFLRTEVCRCSSPTEGPRFAMPPKSLRVGKLTLRGVGERRETLEPSDPSLYVLSTVSFKNDDLDQKLRAYNEWITGSWGNIPLDDVRLLYLVTSTMGREELAQHIEALPDPGEVFVSSQPALRELDSRIWLYKGGTLYEYPPVFGSGNPDIEQSYRDDQKWLIRKLLADND